MPCVIAIRHYANTSKENAMPRVARELSPTGIYHIYSLGERAKTLTRESKDKEELVAILHASKELFDFEIFAYVVTDNELHLILKEHSPKDISNIMKFILSSYTTYYNTKYRTEGALIHDRFVSKPITTDKDLKNLIRYIHQLPVYFKEYPNVFSYPYSSYNDYFNSSPYIACDVILPIFGDEKTALSKFKIFHAMTELNDYRKDKRVRYTVEELDQILFKTCGVREFEVKKMKSEEKLKVAKTLKKKTELSLRQIEKICHVSRASI